MVDRTQEEPTDSADDDRLDALIRAAAPTPPDAGTADRLARQVLALNQAQKRRPSPYVRYVAAACAAAAVIVLAVILVVPDRPGPHAPPRAPRESSPIAATSKTAEELVADYFAGAARMGGVASLPAARRLALRLRQEAPDRGVALAAAATNEPRTFEGAIALLAALGSSAADAAILQVAEAAEDPDQVRTIVSIMARDDARRAEARLSLLARSPRVGSAAIASFARTSPSAAARLFWRERDRRTPDEDVALLAALLPVVPAQDSAFVRAVLDLRGGELLALAHDIGSTRDRRGWPLLRAILAKCGPDPAALAACGGIGAVEAIPLLKKNMICAGPRSDAAIAALGEMRAPEATRALIDAYDGPRGTPDHDRIALALRRHGDVAVRLIAETLERGPRQRAALNLLADLFPDRAAPVLTEAFSGLSPETQAAAVGALGRLRDPAAADLLISLLTDARHARGARDALKQITGVDLGALPPPWREWSEDRHRTQTRSSSLEQDRKGGLS